MRRPSLRRQEAPRCQEPSLCSRPGCHPCRPLSLDFHLLPQTPLVRASPALATSDRSLPAQIKRPFSREAFPTSPEPGGMPLPIHPQHLLLLFSKFTSMSYLFPFCCGHWAASSEWWSSSFSPVSFQNPPRRLAHRIRCVHTGLSTD